MAKENLQMLGLWSSPFSLRVKCALKLKGLEYEYIEDNFLNKSPLLLQYNPVYKKIPVFVHNGKPIAESLVIVEYIEDTWKHNPLLPEDPYERAMARFWIKFGDDKLLDSAWSSFIKQGKEQQDHVVAAMESLEILEQVLSGKKFFGGEAINLADIFLGSSINLINILDEITGVKMNDGDKFPLLSVWIENFSKSAIITDALPSRDQMITMLRGYRENLIQSANK